MSFDPVFRPVGDTLTSLFGITGTYTSVTEDAIDFSTGSISSTNDAQTITMTPPSAYVVTSVDGSIVKSHDMSVIISGVEWDRVFNVQPQADDLITVNNVTYTVINPNPIYSGNLVAAYKFQMSGGESA